MKNNKIKINYRILSILILIFLSFTIMYLSSNNKNINIEYKFNDNIQFKNTSNFYDYYQAKIGEIEIENHGILPSKIYLKNLVGCINFSTYEIKYSFSTKDYKEKIFRTNNLFFTEISSNEKKKLIIKISNNNLKIPNIENMEKSKKISSKLLLIYEIKNDKNLYNPSFCDNLIEENAIKKILIN